MRLLCYSIDHTRADLALRSQVSLHGHVAEKTRQGLMALEGVREALCLSTCNRTELYLVTRSTFSEDPQAVLSQVTSCDLQNLHNVARCERDQSAVLHLFRLCTGLESLVIGEMEILGQVKRAYTAAIEADATGPVLNVLFQGAFNLAKRVRLSSGIGISRVSVASVAVDQIRRRLPNIEHCSAAVWGTGPVGKAVVDFLARAGVRGGAVVSSNLHRARGLSRLWQGSAHTREDVPALLSGVDLFVTCTGSPHTVIHPEMLAGRQPGRPLLLVDLAVPRDVEPSLAQFPGVDLLDMDALQRTVQAGLDERRKAADVAAPIVQHESELFWHCLNARQGTGCLAGWIERMDEQYQKELAFLVKEESLDKRDQALLDKLGRRLFDRLRRQSEAAVGRAIREGLPCGSVLAESCSPEESDALDA